MKVLIALFLLIIWHTPVYAETDTIVGFTWNIMNKIHKSVLNRFVYKRPNPRGETFGYYGSAGMVRGDCDDYASAVYYQLWKLGADPMIYTYDKTSNPKYRHVIVCAKGYCFDNNRPSIFRHAKFMAKVGGVIKLVSGGVGRLNENAMVALLRMD